MVYVLSELLAKVPDAATSDPDFGQQHHNILIVGSWKSDLHERALCRAFSDLGHKCSGYAWDEYLDTGRTQSALKSHLVKMQRRLVAGPLINRINNNLLRVACKLRPDIIFIYRGVYIYAETLVRLKSLLPESYLIGFNNDDPFSPSYPFWMWRHFIAGVKVYDLVLAYRPRNVKDLELAGARNVKLFPPWYRPEVNRPVVLSPLDERKYCCDLMFAGHFENDGRLLYLEEIVKRGWDLKLFGHGYGWDGPVKRSPVLRHLFPVKNVWGDEYNKAICGAKLGLCFFSRLNRDTYTRRCFEIPAAGTALLSEFSTDMEQLFEPDKEAVYFSNSSDLMAKLNLYLNDNEKLHSVAVAGRKRVVLGRHDVRSRAEDILVWVKEKR